MYEGRLGIASFGLVIGVMLTKEAVLEGRRKLIEES